MRNATSGRPGRARALAIWAMLAILAWAVVGPATASAQAVPADARTEYVAPLYGGNLPPGGFHPFSGAPLGGYTPFGVQGPEAGWLKIHWQAGYVEFADSLYFGQETVYGARVLYNGRVGPRPFEWGRGPWNSYGDARVNPTVDIWFPNGGGPPTTGL